MEKTKWPWSPALKHVVDSKMLSDLPLEFTATPVGRCGDGNEVLYLRLTFLTLVHCCARGDGGDVLTQLLPPILLTISCQYRRIHQHHQSNSQLWSGMLHFRHNRGLFCPLSDFNALGP